MSMLTEQGLFDEERTMVTMSFGDHIEELRHHLILALLGLCAGVVFTLAPPLNLGRLVVRQLQEPAQRALATLSCQTGGRTGGGGRRCRVLHADLHADTGSTLSPEPSGKFSPT